MGKGRRLRNKQTINRSVYLRLLCLPWEAGAVDLVYGMGAWSTVNKPWLACRTWSAHSAISCSSSVVLPSETDTASPKSLAAPVAWVAMANGAGACGCNKGSGAQLLQSISSSVLFIFQDKRPFIRFIPATLSYARIYRSPGRRWLDPPYGLSQRHHIPNGYAPGWRDTLTFSGGHGGTSGARRVVYGHGFQIKHPVPGSMATQSHLCLQHTPLSRACPFGLYTDAQEGSGRG